MQLKIHPITLTLKRPFRIAHGVFNSRKAVIIELKEGTLSGFGEATAISYYGKSQQEFMEVLHKHQYFIENQSFTNPLSFWNALYPILKNHPFILCALDVAAHDLWAKKLGQPLYKAWNLSLENIPLSNYTISIDSIENMVQQMQAFPNPVYKIKLGTKEDIEIIKALRQHTTAIFRVDANCAWSTEESIYNAVELKKLGVEFIEQPLAADNWEGMKTLFQKSVLPIIADESCQIESDVLKCHQHFHGINIKLMKCGGFTPALRMINQAKTLGMKVMCGCMTETSIGISAIAQLLPLLDYVDMDGALLLKEDPATGVFIDNGKVTFSTINGIGAQLNNE
jgi:L-alanine-DL-glutamate epimerase-like enolase superfamily enzyme